MNEFVNSTIEKMFQDITKYDLSENKGFLIISFDDKDFSETIKIFNDKCLNICEEYDYEIDGDGDELVKHINICYNPHLSITFNCDDEYINQNNINIYYNNKQIKGFSHTHFDLEDIDENEEIFYAKEYTGCVPYRIINGIKKYDYSGMYFQSDNEQFTFEVKSEDKNGNVKYAKSFKPNYIEMGLNENNIEKFIIKNY